MFGLNMFFLILSVLLVYLVLCNKRVKSLVDKTLQVCEIKLDKALKQKESK